MTKKASMTKEEIRKFVEEVTITTGDATTVTDRITEAWFNDKDVFGFARYDDGRRDGYDSGWEAGYADGQSVDL